MTLILKFFTTTLVFLILIGVKVIAQQYPDYSPTPNISRNPKSDPKAYKPAHKKTIRYIIKPNTRQTLAGNRCFEDQTRKMGYMYLAMPKGQPPYRNEWTRFWNNFGVKCVLIVKNGPFWKVKEKKYYKKCKYGWGDYNG